MSSSAADWEYPEHRQFERYEKKVTVVNLSTSRRLTIPLFQFTSFNEQQRSNSRSSRPQ